MRAGFLPAVCFLFLSLAISATAHAQLAVAPADRDNTLYQNGAGNLSNGAGDHFFAGRTRQASGFIRRGLIHFDLTDLPPGIHVTEAWVRLHVSNSVSTQDEFTLHRILGDWGEGTSDAPGAEGKGTVSTTDSVTWRHDFFPSSFWSSPGGDFDPAVSARLKVDGIGFYFWHDRGLADDVREWINQPSSNFGWLILGPETTSGSAKRFDSRENPNQGVQPTLFLRYCTEPASWQNYGTGWPGTLGVPGFVPSADPVLCTSIDLDIDNSLGIGTQGFVFIGVSAAAIPTSLGGTLRVLPYAVLPVQLPGAGLSFSVQVPCDPDLCGFSVFLQVLEIDSGASSGVSFTPGLELVIGD